MKKEVFTIILFSSGRFVVDATVNTRILYEVDFDALFQGRDVYYDSCAVRAEYQTNNNGSPAISIGQSTGYLTIEGLASNASLGIEGVYLLSLIPTNSNITNFSVGYFYNNTSLQNINGTPMAIPKGVRRFYITSRADSGAIMPAMTGVGQMTLLQFELYNRDEMD
jgi:hypothetical protein